VFDTAITVPTPVLAFAAEGLDMSRYLFACLVVIGLLCLGAFALARLKNSSIVQRAKKRSLRVIDVLPLGRKQRLCVVRAYDRTFVLGVGEREVALVAEIDQDDDLSAEALVQAERDADAAKAPGSFAALVQSFAGAALQRRPAPAAVAAPIEAPVAAPVAADPNDVERRAASAARDALLSILDERRAEVAARREQKRATEKARAKSERAAANVAPTTDATSAAPAAAPAAAAAAPERAPAPKPRTRPAPQPSAPTDGDAAAAPTKTRASWVG
jgi:flagellar biogenesis protein FliO